MRIKMEKYIFYGYYNKRDYELEKFVKNKGHEFIGYIDDNPLKIAKYDYVYGLEILDKYNDAIIIIKSSQIQKILANIRNKGYKNKVLTFPRLRKPYLNDDKDGLTWVKNSQAKLYEIYEEDAYTKKLLSELLYERSMKNFDFIDIERLIDFPREGLYFYDDSLSPKKEFTLINCGAYTGDSIILMHDKFGNRIKKIYAFEPDKNNYKELLKTITKLKISNKTKAFNFALYNKNCTLNLKLDDQSSGIAQNGHIKIEARTLDSLINHTRGDLCINMDIEGAELAAIEGARNLIHKFNPYMAICVYHKMNDVLAVPELIKGINPNYKFFLRCGVHMECYAVPKSHN